MASDPDIRTVRFNPPVYKNKNTHPGVLAKAGDMINVLLKGVDDVGSHPIAEVTILTANDSGTEFTYNPNSANGFLMPNRIVGVYPLHTWECPAAGSYETADSAPTSVANFQVGSQPVHTEAYAATPAGAAALQADLNAALQGDGAASVVYVDAATDYLKIYVMNTTQVVKINGTAVPVQA